MARNSTINRCTECGWSTNRWVGRCAQCQAWGSLTEANSPAAASGSQRPSQPAIRITEVEAGAARGVPTDIGELDRVLGEGLVPGSVVLLGGEPGVGKSTLLLEVAARWAASGRCTLYVTAEESAAQVRLRADRTRALHEELYLAAESDLGVVLGHIEELGPSLLVLDSVQTVQAQGADGVAGGVTQVREVTSALVRTAKRRNMAVLIIGHVTKDGALAGPRTLEHLVDVVLAFDGERHGSFRMVRATKNRYGAADEVGCFEMTETGIREVPDPSGLFTSSRGPTAGTCVTVSLEGRRPLVAEVQALVAPTSLTQPRRVTSGLELSRVTMTLAVLQRRAGHKLHTRDVYASTVGGVRIGDPAADLALAIAVASALRGQEPVGRMVALGEVGLSGEVRRIPALGRRLAEAARLGFTRAIVPGGSGREASVEGMRVIEVDSIDEALKAGWGPGGARVVPMQPRHLA
ncbi:MAG: DNA repair protein RadA [Actinomycetes bacterium]